jgi:putative hydrolase of the HAD superfamily
MAIRSIMLDLYGTLIDIETDESMEEIYRGIAHYLTYQGVYLHRGEVRERYYGIMKQQKAMCREECPEIDVEAIWMEFLRQEGVTDMAARRNLALTLAHLYRGISRKRLRLYPDVKRVLDELRRSYRLALISDAQPSYALPEMKAVGLDGYFDPIVISAEYGYRKPDERLMAKALAIMNLQPSEAIFVGNDMYRDIHGASRLGIRTILVVTNQGEKYHENTTPDYVADRFEDVLTAVAALAARSTAAHGEPGGTEARSEG